ncbi:hypothetical protein CTI14_61725, partial [Methylobacterium radiotolerans]
PILNLTPELYEGWDEIIVYPASFRIPRSRQDEDGVVHEYIEDAAGEAWESRTSCGCPSPRRPACPS